MKNIVVVSILIIFLSVNSSCKKKIVEGSGPEISALSCGTSSFSATATSTSAYNAIATVPYAGGNGIGYEAGQTISSYGVTGLAATLQTGTLSVGNGNLSFIISGTPATSGLAKFDIDFYGYSCTMVLNVNSGTSPSLPTVYSKIYGASSMTFDGTYVTIKTSDLPDHKSIYWPLNHPLYEAFSGPTFQDSTFVRAPGNIITQNITLKIPANPTMANTHARTPMGVIGIGLDGVPFFNQYAAGGVSLGAEIHGFDQYHGHPQMTGMYHYHVEPTFLTTVRATRSSLMGFLLDGFPVYGPEEEGGAAPTGLDVYHGHVHNTIDYPSGIYHYHFTGTTPYLNGNGFWGTAGTVTQ